LTPQEAQEAVYEHLRGTGTWTLVQDLSDWMYDDLRLTRAQGQGTLLWLWKKGMIEKRRSATVKSTYNKQMALEYRSIEDVPAPKPVKQVLKRDPRLNPKAGDVLDDDPPLPPLEVIAVRCGHVTAFRYLVKKAGNKGYWDGGLPAWRREMKGVTVRKVVK